MRELLINAFKAMDLGDITEIKEDGRVYYNGVTMNRLWNPLNSWDHCMEMVVKLDIELDIGEEVVSARSAKGRHVRLLRDNDGKEIRLAVLHAAARLGENYE